MISSGHPIYRWRNWVLERESDLFRVRPYGIGSKCQDPGSVLYPLSHPQQPLWRVKTILCPEVLSNNTLSSKTITQISVLTAEVSCCFLRTETGSISLFLSALVSLFSNFGCPLEHGMWRLEWPASHRMPVTHVPWPFLTSGQLNCAGPWVLLGVADKAGGRGYTWALTGVGAQLKVSGFSEGEESLACILLRYEGAMFSQALSSFASVCFVVPICE